MSQLISAGFAVVGFAHGWAGSWLSGCRTQRKKTVAKKKVSQSEGQAGVVTCKRADYL